MAKSVKINGVTYSDVKEIKIPLASDPTQDAVFPDTSDADAAAESIKQGETAYVDGKKVTGSMPVNGAGGGTIYSRDETVSIGKGFYDGTGKVGIAETEKEKLIAANIRHGVSVLGVEGSMSTTEGAKPQAKTVTPTKSKQVVQPDSGYNYLSTVTVNEIPAEYITTDDANAEAEHIAKGKTAYVKGQMVTGIHTDPTFSLADGVLSIA